MELFSIRIRRTFQLVSTDCYVDPLLRWPNSVTCYQLRQKTKKDRQEWKPPNSLNLLCSGTRDWTGDLMIMNHLGWFFMIILALYICLLIKYLLFLWCRLIGIDFKKMELFVFPLCSHLCSRMSDYSILFKCIKEENYGWKK